MGEGNAELPNVDRLNSAITVNRREAVAGVVADGAKILEVMEVHTRQF